MKSILVVDDELINAEVLSLILQDEGYRTFIAADGLEGLARARELSPHLVILDYMMPLMNGAQMGRALRADPALAGTRILMNSSLPEDKVRPHFDGYDGFLRKPYNVERALELIAELLLEPRRHPAP